MPHATHRMMPPEVYCVKEYLRSVSATSTFEWDTQADGMKIVDPGGNSMTSFKSHNTKWPPRL